MKIAEQNTITQPKLNLKIISAGAGSGKTYRLTQEMVALLKSGVKPSGLIATTFTVKAAAELQERVRIKLLEDGMADAANDLSNALIGTVHSVGTKLLRRFAFEAGVSPEIEIIADEDQQVLFNKSLSSILHPKQIRKIELLATRLGLNKKGDAFDWRRDIKNITDTARANDFSVEVLLRSKAKSYEDFIHFLGQASTLDETALNDKLVAEIGATLAALHANDADGTKVTNNAISFLKACQNNLKNKGQLNWHEWAKLSKLKTGAKSKNLVENLKEFAALSETHPGLRQDVKDFVDEMFDISIAALEKYDEFKKKRGLIDYTDMELEVKKLLDNQNVIKVLSEEIELLMVDEFQDTSPIQLDMFLKLSRLAKHSIWVGDPKQSIYGFRGAEPRLMQAIIDACGGVKEEDIQKHSWRSREEIVLACNALFNKAFTELPNERISLFPKRCCKASEESQNNEDEPVEVGLALKHWHFQKDGGSNRAPNKAWVNDAIAERLREFLATEPIIFDKEEKIYRPARPGDVAILCRTNFGCAEMAKSLHKMGLKAAISRSGLLNTAEVKLILACLKFIQNKHDSLSVAEILLLAEKKNLEEIIDDRLNFLEEAANSENSLHWPKDNAFIDKLNEMRQGVVELSSAEILNLVLENLDLRRIIVSWGSLEQRLDNIDVLRKFALQYEDACRRLHTAASLGGFLLWLNELAYKEKDRQGSGEGPDSVNVLTYHKSKGLEWPVLIAHKLDARLRDRLWGLNIIPETDEIDLNNILGNRWLRYWVNPYADQIKSTGLEARINESEVKAKAKQAAMSEDVRVLYVGLTRARDYLIFPTVFKIPTRWLNRTWHEGNEDMPTLDENTEESQWLCGDRIILKETEVCTFGPDIPAANKEKQAILYLEKPAGSDKFHHPFLISSTEEPEGFSAKTSSIIQYGRALGLQEDAEIHVVKTVYHHFLLADNLDYPERERLVMAEGLLERHEASDMLKPEELLQCGKLFHSYIHKNWAPEKLHRCLPINYREGNRRYIDKINFVAETSDTLMIVQGNPFTGEQRLLRNHALESARDMAWKLKAVRAAFSQKNIRCFVHFFLMGMMVEVEI